ncbi:MAG: hypothetical protein AAB445_03565 [Patescibacteria group bacterium]
MKCNCYFPPCLATFGTIAKCRVDQSRIPQSVLTDAPIDAERVKRALEFTRKIAGVPENLEVYANKIPAKAAGHLAHITEQRRVDMVGRNGRLESGQQFYGDAFAIFVQAYIDDDPATTQLLVNGMYDGSPFVSIRRTAVA